MFTKSAKCLYHRDATKTYWALAKLAPTHPVEVGKVLTCIDNLYESEDKNTQYMDEVSECLKDF